MNVSYKKLWVLALLICQLGFGNVYQQKFQSIMNNERQIWAPKLSRLKIAESLLISNQYFEKLIGQFALSASDFDVLVQRSARLLDLIESQSETLSIKNYESLIKQTLEHRIYTSHAAEKVAWARRVVAAFDNNQHFFADYCRRRISLLPPIGELPSIPSIPGPSGTVYTKHEFGLGAGEGTGSMSSDPKADAAALTTMNAALIVAVLYGGVQITFLGTSVAAVMTGASAAIALGGFAVALVIAYAVTEYQNDKRKKEAEKEYQEEIDAFNSAKNWFFQNRLTQEEFHSLALEICQGEYGLTVISDSANSLKIAHEGLQSDLTNLEASLAIMRTNSTSLEGLVQHYTQRLIEQYSAEYVYELRQKILIKEKLNAAIEFYNLNLKPIKNELFEFYIQFREDCFMLEDELYRKRTLIDGYREFLKDNYYDVEHAHHNFYLETIPDLEEDLIKAHQSRVKRCFEREEGEGGFNDPIYRF